VELLGPGSPWWYDSPDPFGTIEGRARLACLWCAPQRAYAAWMPYRAPLSRPTSAPLTPVAAIR